MSDFAAAWRAHATDFADCVRWGVIVVHVATLAIGGFHGVNDLGITEWRERDDV